MYRMYGQKIVPAFSALPPSLAVVCDEYGCPFVSNPRAQGCAGAANMSRLSGKQHGRSRYSIVCRVTLVYARAMRTHFLIILMLLSFSASAAIYKWVDDKGKVHYSDKEVTGAEEVNLPAAVTYSPVPVDSSATNKPTQEVQVGYTAMSILKPKMNETIRSNNGDVQVEIELKPSLRPDDTITLYLDGKVVLKGGVKTSVTLATLDRGSHTLRATVFDKNGVALIISKAKPEEKADFGKNYKKSFGKDFGSSGTYQDKAKDFNTGIPSSKGTFSPGSTFSPNYNQKK